MTKGLLAVLALLGIAGYFGGFFGSSGYSRDVGRPQAQVMAALTDLDITAQPGAPGSTAEAAGGVKPSFRLEKAAGHMTWYVMSGKRVAVKMTATFEPLDNGKRTRVRANVERGDAPDDFVSPAFRSTGLTMALFGMALEGELDKLTTTASYRPERCRELLEEFTDGNLANLPVEQPGNLPQAVGQTSKSIMRIAAMEAELRRNGCPTGNSGGFRYTHSSMGDPGAEPDYHKAGTPDAIPTGATADDRFTP